MSPSPDWMCRRLVACGTRPINVLVDITNYVLFETGQPLHVFDADRLAAARLIVRRARADEPLTTLDAMRRRLPAGTLVIADANGPVAVAGVLGGLDSAVHEGTTRVVLESAVFDPVTVRRTARALGLASESSYRFERGVDPESVEPASARAAALLRALAGGRETARTEVGRSPARRTLITLDMARAERLLGLPVAATAARTALVRLGCRVAAGRGGALQVFPPPRRPDLTGPADLYEELARLIGYDRIPVRLPTAALAVPDAPSTYAHARDLRDRAASTGLTEVVTWSLVSEADVARCGFAPTQAVRLVNPISQDHAFIRPSLLIGLLQAVQRNLARGRTDIALFEVGRVSRPGPGGAAEETTRLGIALTGGWGQDWARPHSPGDFFVLKGLVVRLLGAAASRLQTGETDAAWADLSERAALVVDGRVVGIAGRVAGALRARWDLPQEVWCAELEAECLPDAGSRGAITAPPQFPPVKRDLSVVVGDAVAFARVEQVVRAAGGALLARAVLIDRFAGRQVAAGSHSLTLSLEYRHAERTLTAAEADAVHQQIVAALRVECGATLR